jgi:hypothetical protein
MTGENETKKKTANAAGIILNSHDNIPIKAKPARQSINFGLDWLLCYRSGDNTV